MTDKSNVTYYRQLGTDEVKPNTWNPNTMDEENQERLERSITLYDQLQPIIIDENNVIIDGFHRWKQAKKLGKKFVDVYIIKGLTLAQKQDLSLSMNQIKGVQDPYKVAQLLSNIKDEELKGIAQFVLPYNEFEISQMTAMLKEDDERKQEFSDKMANKLDQERQALQITPKEDSEQEHQKGKGVMILFEGEEEFDWLLHLLGVGRGDKRVFTVKQLQEANRGKD